jgi:hypothetical protein
MKVPLDEGGTLLLRTWNTPLAPEGAQPDTTFSLLSFSGFLSSLTARQEIHELEIRVSAWLEAKEAGVRTIRPSIACAPTLIYCNSIQCCSSLASMSGQTLCAVVLGLQQAEMGRIILLSIQ